MKKRIFLIIISFVFFATSCDIVEKPYIEQNDMCGQDNMSVPIKKVLVEDYTGFKCGNCPQAHEILHRLKDNYCDHIIPVAIHVGYFATPSGSMYTTDYRTEAGNTYNDVFGADAAGLPVGMVNRIEYNGTRLLSPDSWADAVAKQIDEPLVLDVQLNNVFNSTDREVETSVNVYFIKDINAKLNLNIWLVEDSITDYQKDYESNPVDIPDYVHRHVFRKSVTPVWGDEILNGSVSASSTRTYTYTFKVDTAWNAEHCHVVAFVADASSYEVLQAEDEKLK